MFFITKTQRFLRGEDEGGKMRGSGLVVLYFEIRNYC